MKRKLFFAAVVLGGVLAIYLLIGGEQIRNFFVSNKSLDEMAVDGEPKVNQPARDKRQAQKKTIEASDAELGLKCASGQLINTINTFPFKMTDNVFCVFLKPHTSTYWFDFHPRGFINIYIWARDGYLECETQIIALSKANQITFDLPARARVVAGNQTARGIIHVYRGKAVAWGDKTDIRTNRIQTEDCWGRQIYLKPSSLQKIDNMNLKKGQALFIISEKYSEMLEHLQFSPVFQGPDPATERQFLLYNWNSEKGEIEKVKLKDTFPIVWQITKPGDIYLGGLDEEISLYLTPITEN